MKSWLLLLLTVSAPCFGERIHYGQSLLQNGTNASSYAELGLQKDSIMNNDLLSARVQGGWLLSKSPYLATTIGAAYTGFGAKAKDRDSAKVLNYSYYGPVFEAIAFPDRRWKGILSYSLESGFMKRGEKQDSKDFFYSTLQIQEIRASLAFSIDKYQQIFLGLADQKTQLNHFYKLEKDGDLFRRRGQKQQNSLSYFLGVRLAAF